jgi:hypothetical protein
LGAVIPVAATAAYYWLEDAFGDMIDGTLVFPFTDLNRGGQSFGDRLGRIEQVVATYYPETAVLFYGGLVLLLLLVALRLARGRHDLHDVVRNDPLVNVVFASLLLVAAVSASDFQGYPDLYPLLPYAALGVGGGFALLLERFTRAGLRRLGSGIAVTAAAVLVLVSWFAYSHYTAEALNTEGLRHQRNTAGKIERLLDGGETLYALGNATPLVLTDRRNPSPYIYLSAGVDTWVVDHTPGGLSGWHAQIVADDPAIIVKGGPWGGEIADATERWLAREYPQIRVGGLTLFLKPSVYARAERRGLVRPRPD